MNSDVLFGDEHDCVRPLILCRYNDSCVELDFHVGDNEFTSLRAGAVRTLLIMFLSGRRSMRWYVTCNFCKEPD